MSHSWRKGGVQGMPNSSFVLDRLPDDGERMTTTQYLRTPESLRVQELHHGILHVAESPAPRHQRLVFKLARTLAERVEPARLGEVFIAPLDVILDQGKHLVVQPDLFYVARARAHIVSDRVWGPPDLVVEVLSPNLRLGNLQERLEWFAAYGVRECWLVHQLAGQIEVIRFGAARVATRREYGGQDAVASDVIPDLDLRLDDLLGP